MEKTLRGNTNSKMNKRPEQLYGRTHKVNVSCGNLYVTVNRHEGKIMEVFATLGKGGSCTHCFCEFATRMLTLALRMGVTVDKIIQQGVGIQCPKPIMFPKDVSVLSCPDAIIKVLQKEHNKQNGEQNVEHKEINDEPKQ